MKNNLELFNSWWYEGRCSSDNPFDSDKEPSKFWAYEGYLAGKLNKGVSDEE